MLTQEDLDQVEELTRNIVKEEVKHLPSKDEFYKSMDEIMGELKTIREEQTLITYRSSDHEERITRLEELHSSDLQS